VSEMAQSEPQEPAAANGGDCPKPEEDFVLVEGKHRFNLRAKVATMLYPHQREGIKWLWSLHTKGMGGILGDDMGLGKTMQVGLL
jgi:SNF2 family DNA or RNA helicase